MCFMHTLQWPMNLSYFLTTNILRTQVHDTHEQYNHYYIVHSCSGAIHNRHIHTLNIQGEMYVNGGHHAMIHDLFCLHSGSQPQYFHMQFMYACKGAQFRQALDLTHDEIFGFSMDLMFGGCVCVCFNTNSIAIDNENSLNRNKMLFINFFVAVQQFGDVLAIVRHILGVSFYIFVCSFSQRTPTMWARSHVDFLLFSSGTN